MNNYESKRFKTNNKKLDDDVELYYPHYYKGYGLIPVEKLDIGEVQGETVGVFDWETILMDDTNFIQKPEERISKVAKRLKTKMAKAQNSITG